MIIKLCCLFDALILRASNLIPYVLPSLTPEQFIFAFIGSSVSSFRFIILHNIIVEKINLMWILYELYKYIFNVFVSSYCLNTFTEMYKTLRQFNFILGKHYVKYLFA